MESSDGPDVATALRAGVALYNTGWFHAAHDPWEEVWLRVRETAPEDAALLQGLIQTTAAVHHASANNPEGAEGLAGSAAGYLADLPADYRGVNLDAVRAFLPELEADPTGTGGDPPTLRVDGRALTLPDLEFPAASAAAPALAAANGLEAAVVERAVSYARADLADSPTSPFVDAILAFVAGSGAPRRVAHDRLRRRVHERDAKERDVSGLFD
jgi:hypothetical protein